MEPGPTADPALSHPSPTDLRFSDLGSREVKLHWTNPAKPVQQYRVVYHSAEGQSPQEVRHTNDLPTTLGFRHKHSYIKQKVRSSLQRNADLSSPHIMFPLDPDSGRDVLD